MKKAISCEDLCVRRSKGVKVSGLGLLVDKVVSVWNLLPDRGLRVVKAFVKQYVESIRWARHTSGEIFMMEKYMFCGRFGFVSF